MRHSYKSRIVTIVLAGAIFTAVALPAAHADQPGYRELPRCAQQDPDTWGVRCQVGGAADADSIECRVSLNLLSLRVWDDTEPNGDEWVIDSASSIGGRAGATASADSGQTHTWAAFGIAGPVNLTFTESAPGVYERLMWVQAAVRETNSGLFDAGEGTDDTGSDFTLFRLRCIPDQNITRSIAVNVHGNGIDFSPGPIPGLQALAVHVNFDVTVGYRWFVNG